MHHTQSRSEMCIHAEMIFFLASEQEQSQCNTSGYVTIISIATRRGQVLKMYLYDPELLLTMSNNFTLQCYVQYYVTSKG